MRRKMKGQKAKNCTKRLALSKEFQEQRKAIELVDLDSKAAHWNPDPGSVGTEIVNIS